MDLQQYMVNKEREYKNLTTPVQKQNFESQTTNEFNSKREAVHGKKSNGLEFWNKYDTQGNIIHIRYSDGTQCWKDYDDKKREVHRKYSYGKYLL